MNQSLELTTSLRLSKEAIAAAAQTDDARCPLRSLSRDFLYEAVAGDVLTSLPADGRAAVTELEERAGRAIGLRELILLELLRRDFEVIEVAGGCASSTLPLPLGDALGEVVLRFAGGITGETLADEVDSAEQHMGLTGDFHRGSALVPALELLGASETANSGTASNGGR